MFRWITSKYGDLLPIAVFLIVLAFAVIGLVLLGMGAVQI